MKTLESILKGFPYSASGPLTTPVTDIVMDSRQVKPGALFVALRGVHVDGRQFIAAAVAAGARSILTDEDVPMKDVTVIHVTDTLQALAHVSAQFWDHPSRSLRMIGITGTNGKTTTSYLIEAVCKAAGWPAGVIGTINYRFQADSQPACNTTPFAGELQRFLAALREKGAKACVMEVSSHALELGRVEGVEFDVAIFTNLTQDHLDFHKTMDAYAAAKARLFDQVAAASPKPFPRAVVLNADDPWSDTMAKHAHVPILRYRLHASVSGGDRPADIYTKDLVCDSTGSRFELHTPGGQCPVRLPLLGDYNVMNALAAVGAGLSQGIALPVIVQGLESMAGVPGRMERMESPRGFTVVVDYAHTEDALRQVMTALRKLKPARLLTVFGCGGDRDRTKRPMMGEAAAQLSAEVIVTSDNPRSEDPARIALDVEVGVRRVRCDHYEIILDRQAAIARIFALAQPGDIVLIAGKGHENYQILPDRTVPFDDREVARRLLRKSS